jgi:hypothetical protein
LNRPKRKSPGQANAVNKALEARVGAERIEARPQQHSRVKPLFVSFFKPIHAADIDNLAKLFKAASYRLNDSCLGERELSSNGERLRNLGSVQWLAGIPVRQPQNPSQSLAGNDRSWNTNTEIWCFRTS